VYKSQGGGPGSYTEEREKEIFLARIMVSSMRSPAGTRDRAVAVLRIGWAQSTLE
jgi:hypothetical protein